jgi:glycerophosphoryl diester phosphodiesterase
MKRIALLTALSFTAVFVGIAAAAELPSPKGALRVIAHRGASGYAPENTMASFKKALEMGAEMIEFDVHLTKDGSAVILHDDTVDRTTGRKDKISDLTYDEVSKLDAGSWFSKDFAGEKIPTLQEVLEWANGKIQVNIEIKAAGCEKIVVDLINKLGMKNSAIVSSFDHGIIKKIRELDPEIAVAALISDITDAKQIDDIIGNCKPDAVNPRYLYLNKTAVKAAHEKGLSVNVYTVNDPVTMQRLVKMGVDGIFSNYPDVLLTTLGKMKKAPQKKTG